MKFKYDGGMFNSVYQFICYRDKQFSEKITELFLIGLNRSDQVEDTNSLLCVTCFLYRILRAFCLLMTSYLDQGLK